MCPVDPRYSIAVYSPTVRARALVHLIVLMVPCDCFAVHGTSEYVVYSVTFGHWVGWSGYGCYNRMIYTGISGAKENEHVMIN